MISEDERTFRVKVERACEQQFWIMGYSRWEKAVQNRGRMRLWSRCGEGPGGYGAMGIGNGFELAKQEHDCKLYKKLS